MSLRVEKCVDDRWRQNCYMVANSAGETIIIDPGGGVDKVAGIIEKRGWRPLAVLNTHAHFDHIGGVAGLMDRFQIPFYMSGADLGILRNANLYKFLFDSRESVTIPKLTHDLRNLPSVLRIGGFALRWMATPGHTPGSVCFHLEGHLFAGDTLLPQGPGRTDLPGGNPADLAVSLRKLAALPPETLLHAGHGESTTLAAALARVTS